jgi:hypothetical protein
MRLAIEAIGKQRFDVRPAEFPGRQADAVDNEEFRFGAVGSFVLIG